MDAIIPFLQKEAADLICLQEVFEEDLSEFKYPCHLFLPTWKTKQHSNLEIKESYEPGDKLFGIAMLSRKPLSQVLATRLDPNLPQTPKNTGPGTWNPGLMVAKVNNLIVATTHFTWTRNGLSDDRQRQHLKTMLELLSPYSKLLFLGDFNAPRGEEIHSVLAKKFVDRTPKNIVTTLDPKLHYANRHQSGKLKLVVDHVFTTPNIGINKIEIKDGLSDHCAIVAQLDHQS